MTSHLFLGRDLSLALSFNSDMPGIEKSTNTVRPELQCLTMGLVDIPSSFSLFETSHVVAPRPQYPDTRTRPIDDEDVTAIKRAQLT